MISADLVVDHGPGVGLGHLRRCLVLGDALCSRGVAVRFLIPTTEGQAFAASRGFAAGGWDVLITADVVVVDAYGMDPASLVVPPGSVSLWIDDVGDRRLDVDLVLNPNGYGAEIDYHGHPRHGVLTGLRYSLVSHEFVEVGRSGATGGGFLVVFGGTDDGTLALPVARALRAARPETSIDVVVSPLHHLDADAPAVAVHHGADMAALMARCKVYVGAAGGTCYEGLAAGLVVVACPVFDNQEQNAAFLSTMGADVVPRYDVDALVDAALRSVDGPSPPPPEHPDGRGAARVADRLLDLVEAASRGER